MLERPLGIGEELVLSADMIALLRGAYGKGRWRRLVMAASGNSSVMTLPRTVLKKRFALLSGCLLKTFVLSEKVSCRRKSLFFRIFLSENRFLLFENTIRASNLNRMPPYELNMSLQAGLGVTCLR